MKNNNRITKLTIVISIVFLIVLLATKPIYAHSEYTGFIGWYYDNGSYLAIGIFVITIVCIIIEAIRNKRMKDKLINDIIEQHKKESENTQLDEENKNDENI